MRMKSTEKEQNEVFYCKYCGEFKPLSEMRRDNRQKRKCLAECKTCRNKREWDNGSTLRARYRTVMKQAKEVGVTSTLTFEEFKEVIKRPNCEYCGEKLNPREEKGSTVDHIYNKASGYANGYINLSHACKSCNSSKGDSHIYDFYQRSDKFTDELFRKFVREFTFRLTGIDDERAVDPMIENLRTEALEYAKNVQD